MGRIKPSVKLAEVSKIIVRKKYMFFSGVMLCVITYSSLMNLNSLGKSFLEVFNHNDKLFHFFSYFVFAFLLKFSLNYDNIIKECFLFTFLFVLLLLFGILIEYIQIFFQRTFDLKDWLADSIGVLMGELLAVKFLFFWGVSWKKRKRL